MNFRTDLAIERREYREKEELDGVLSSYRKENDVKITTIEIIIAIMSAIHRSTSLLNFHCTYIALSYVYHLNYKPLAIYNTSILYRKPCYVK